jgi:beta-glucanase (GH16 family)
MAILAMLVGATFVLVVSLGAGASAAPPCDKVASPLGLDSWPGSETQPVRTARKLADLLLPGETGCLKAGVYPGGLTLRNGGTQGNPVTLESYSGERARISGLVSVEPGADFVTISGLDLVGVNPGHTGSPFIQADHVRLEGNDITNNQTADCVVVGTWERQVTDTVIEDNRIHNCGELPPTNRDHGISIWNANATQITDNVIYDNANRGIQLFPNAQQTSVVHNTIDGNGEGILISGTGGRTSDDNKIERNVISNSTTRYNVETYWPDADAVGSGNLLRNNCVFGGANAEGNGGIPPNFDGLVATGNLVADPGYADRAGKDFRLRPESPCVAQIGDSSGSGPPPGETWNLAFDDRFDGPLLNLAAWHTCFWWSTLTCSIPSNDELELYNPADVYVADGNLRMRAQRRDMIGWNGQTYHYTSGMAITGGRKYEKPPGFTFTYGYAEARVKIPKGKGLWPAFWLLPADYGYPPEIDILEARGSDTNRANFNLHFTGVNTGSGYSGPDFSAGYHTFAVDWQPTVLVFYVDGIERWRYTGPGIPNEPMYMVLNLAVGGIYDGAPDASTPLPSYFDVDYARVWQRG